VPWSRRTTSRNSGRRAERGSTTPMATRSAFARADLRGRVANQQPGLDAPPLLDVGVQDRLNPAEPGLLVRTKRSRVVLRGDECDRRRTALLEQEPAQQVDHAWSDPAPHV